MSDNQANADTGRVRLSADPEQCVTGFRYAFQADRQQLASDISSELTLIKMSLHTNLRWLDRDAPDVEAAKRTASRLLDHMINLERLIKGQSVQQ